MGDVNRFAARGAAQMRAENLSGVWTVVGRRERLETDAPPPPYTTADLLVDAAGRLHWSAERTMRVAQSLFEGGYITYPRTDSTRVAPQVVERARRAVAALYGQDALPQPGETVPRLSPGESGFVQDAHEAVRPTDPDRQPGDVPPGEERLLYRLIWSRFLAAFMRPARVRVVTLTLEKT